MKTLEEKIDLMVRFMEARSWTDDPELNKVREWYEATYATYRKVSNALARKEGNRAVLRKIFEDD